MKTVCADPEAVPRGGGALLARRRGVVWPRAARGEGVMIHQQLRIPEDLARVLRIAAAARGQSVHAYMLAAIRASILRDGARDQSVAAALDRIAAGEGGVR